MNRLPSEILHIILILVPFQDRLKCTLVCRHWYSTLCERSLLNNIVIKHDEQFISFLDLLERTPSRGYQVEDLYVETRERFDTKKICGLLPNLRTICCTCNYFPDQHRHKIPNVKLEILRDRGVCELSGQLLRTSDCTHLRILELELNYTEGYKIRMLNLLGNAPALKELILRFCRVGIDDFEIIHKNAPGLEAFECDYVNPDSDELPNIIIPATSVTSFKIYMHHLMDAPYHANLYRYISKKYPNLKHFKFRDEGISQADSNHVMEIYQNGILPIYKNNGSRLQYFDATNIPIEWDIFNVLDGLDLRLSEIHLTDNQNRPILEQLVKSNQPHYVGTLEFKNTFIASPTMLNGFTSLRELTINQDDQVNAWDVNLTDYLNAFPSTLTHFTATFRETKITELPSHPSNIQHLVLRCTTLYPELGEIITTHFPKLKALTLQGHVLENINIHVPNNHLIHLQIDAYYVVGPIHVFSITNTSNPRPQYYVQERDSDKLIPIMAHHLQGRIMIDLKYVTAMSTGFHSTSSLKKSY